MTQTDDRVSVIVPIRDCERYIAEALESRGTDERSVAGENKDVVIVFDGILRAHHGMAGTALLALVDKIHAG